MYMYNNMQQECHIEALLTASPKRAENTHSQNVMRTFLLKTLWETPSVLRPNYIAGWGPFMLQKIKIKKK